MPKNRNLDVYYHSSRSESGDCLHVVHGDHEDHHDVPSPEHVGWRIVWEKHRLENGHHGRNRGNAGNDHGVMRDQQEVDVVDEQQSGRDKVLHELLQEERREERENYSYRAKQVLGVLGHSRVQSAGFVNSEQNDQGLDNPRVEPVEWELLTNHGSSWYQIPSGSS